jgi:hypothetical protein
MWRTKSFPDVFLRQPANPFLEVGIAPGAATSGEAHHERDDQGPQKEMGTVVVGGTPRTRHAGAYATLDDRQVQLSWNLLWRDQFDGYSPLGDWIYR